MIKKMLLALCLMFSAEARAQFAAGYAPVRPEAAPSGEEQQSVLFRQAPAPAEAAPRPAEPENIRKPTPYTGSIRILAQVNGDIITTEDINHRVRAFCMTTGIPYNRQTKLLIINKVMQNTIDEKLKGRGRLLLRESGTEPVIRIMVECEDETECEAYAAQVEALIRERGLSDD